MKKSCKIKWLCCVWVISIVYPLTRNCITDFCELNYIKLGNLFHIYHNFIVGIKDPVSNYYQWLIGYFKIENGVPKKSSITRVPKISKEQLDHIVQNIIRKTNTDSDEFEELDLSEFSSIDAQIEFLKRQGRVDTLYITQPGQAGIEDWRLKIEDWRFVDVASLRPF